MSDVAPAVDLYFDDHADGNIILQDVQIPLNASHVNTYYCALMFNNGKEGQGYCGLQDAAQGHDAIFSMWDSKSSGTHPTAAHLGPGTSQHRFGGEGTGLQTINYGFGWHDLRWYTFAVRAWPYGNHSRFGLWIHDQSAGKWHHHATIELPHANVKFSGGTGAFLEDWARDGNYSRSVYFKNGYKHTTSGQWIPFKTVSYGVHGGSTHANNYDVRAVGASVWVASGAGVNPTVPKNGSVHLDSSRIPSQPSKPPISFSITSATHNHVSWNVPESSTPQFSYVVRVDGHGVAYGNSSEVRSANFNHPGGRTIEVKLEDILGRTTTHTHYISRM